MKGSVVIREASCGDDVGKKWREKIKKVKQAQEVLIEI